jgi:hypothetical protein
VATKANLITTEAGQLCTQVPSLTQTQRAEEANTTQSVAQLYQLSVLLKQVQQDLQQHKLKVPDNVGIPGPSLNPRMPHGMPIEDVVLQLQIELQVVQFRLRSDAYCVGGYTFQPYENTLKWVTANCSAEDWQYAMDMPALYSLVQPDGQYYQVLFEEQSHSSKAGYASSTQGQLDLSFKTKVPVMFGYDRTSKTVALLLPLISMTSGFQWGSCRSSEIKWKNLPRLWNPESLSK